MALPELPLPKFPPAEPLPRMLPPPPPPVVLPPEPKGEVWASAAIGNPIRKTAIIVR